MKPMKKTLKEYIELLEQKGLLAECHISDEIANQEINYISHNSLDVKEGTLFICKGLNFKEQYLNDALEGGAVCYMAERVFDIEPDGGQFIIVNNMRKAMSEVSAIFL